MKFLRITLSNFVLLILVSIFAVASLVWLVDPNKLKPALTEKVLRDTGYQLVIDGSLTWTFYPHFGVKVAHMSLTAPKQTAPFVELHDDARI